MGAPFVPVSAREMGNWRSFANSAGETPESQRRGDPLIPTHPANTYKGPTAFIFPSEWQFPQLLGEEEG